MKKQIKISQKHSGAGVVKSFIVKYIDPDKLNMWSDTGRGEDGRYDGRTVRMVDATGYYIEDMTVQYLKNCREHGLTAGDELYDEDTDTMSHAFILNTEEIDQIIKFVEENGSGWKRIEEPVSIDWKKLVYSIMAA